jgi:hypothetical protein
MKARVSIFFAMIFSMQAVSLIAQTPEMEALGYTNPGFTLTISKYNGGELLPGTHDLIVRTTNTSSSVIRWGGCLALRGMYNISILYNGAPIEESDAVRRLKKYRKEDGGCRSGLVSWTIKPGEYHDDQLSITEFYDMSKPGTYEIAVSRDSFPDNPDKNVTIKSNTLTIIVPEPEAAAPK